MRSRSRWYLPLAAGCAALLGMAAAPASADKRIYELNDGLYQASAVFELEGTTGLRVTLTNTSTNASVDPAHTLTAVFFDMQVPDALTKVSAQLAAGSSVVDPEEASSYSTDKDLAKGTKSGVWLNPEWAYRDLAGVTGAPRQYGISSTGIGLFGPDDRFDTANDLDSPASPDGLNYGIIGSATNLVGDCAHRPLVRDAVVFHFTDYGSLLSNIRNVQFQYGTAPDYHSPSSVPPDEVPEPAAVQLASLLALSGVGLWRARARKA